MKKLILLFITALLGAINLNAQKGIDSFEIQVDGLGCPFCAYGLEKKFKEFKGIKNIAINIETGDFSFTYPTTKPLTMEVVVNQVKKAGYTPISAKITRANGKIETLNKTTSLTATTTNTTTAVFTVEGVCEMCKARIEAISLENKGVQSAIWNKETKEITINFEADKITTETIALKIANEGHDNTYAKAPNKAYENLPMCCTYRNKNLEKH